MSRSQLNRWRIFALLILLSLPFHNCSTGFKSSAQLSVQCTEKIRQEGARVKTEAVDCVRASLYSCERRAFSPDVANGVSMAEECTEDMCVQVTTRSFDTSAAKLREPANAFLPGGDYNHEEVACTHAYRYKDVAAFVGRASNLEQALVFAQLSCAEGGK